jgi:hypothetical protein
MMDGSQDPAPEGARGILALRDNENTGRRRSARHRVDRHGRHQPLPLRDTVARPGCNSRTQSRTSTRRGPPWCARRRRTPIREHRDGPAVTQDPRGVDEDGRQGLRGDELRVATRPPAHGPLRRRAFQLVGTVVPGDGKKDFPTSTRCSSRRPRISLRENPTRAVFYREGPRLWRHRRGRQLRQSCPTSTSWTGCRLADGLRLRTPHGASS